MVENKTIRIDLFKLLMYILKRAWVLILCGAIGFAGMYWYSMSRSDTYTSSGTLYVYNANPNLVNYQYTNSADLNSAVQLLNTYMVVVRSNKVMDVVAEQLASKYPGIQPSYIARTLSMGSVNETGVLSIRCVTDDAQKSADICNAVMETAPAEIIRVVNAGSIEIIDYAEVPLRADSRFSLHKAIIGIALGMILGAALLVLVFLFDGKITTLKELKDNYTPPVLASVRRVADDAKKPGKRGKRGQKTARDPSQFMLTDKSDMEDVENYSKLRMNLLYTLVGKKERVVVVTSAVPGEGKSTITANLAISCATSGKQVLLMDGDLRRACQRDIFHYDKELPGLSDVLIGSCSWQDTLLTTSWDSLAVMPAGHFPPNPTELLDSEEMRKLLKELSEHYDLVLIDAPPINVVTDPLTLSSCVAGCLFVVRQNFSDNGEVRKALTSAEMTGMNVLGFVFYGENIQQSNYYNRKHYKDYYHQYDHRDKPARNSADNLVLNEGDANGTDSEKAHKKG